MKSFLQFSEALPAASPAPMGGGMPPSLGGGGMGGGMPPMPPPSLGGGGMGGGMPPMGGGDGGMQPVPVKTIDVMDVWEILKHSMKNMDKHEELNINYHRTHKDKKNINLVKNSSLLK